MAKEGSGKAFFHSEKTSPDNGLAPERIGYLLPEDSPVGDLEYKIAVLAWEKGLAENSILKDLGWARTPENYMKVRRALRKAVNNRLLVLNPPRNRDLENRLVAKFPYLKLDNIHVEVDRAAACLAAARLIAKEIEEFVHDDSRHEMVIANAGGRTVRDTISYLQRFVPVLPQVKDKKLVFLSLNNAEIHNQFDQCANFISVRLAQIYAAIDTQHFAVVKPFNKNTHAEYLAKVNAIDLVISSAAGRQGFLSDWLKGWKKELSKDAVGDVAFHLIDSKGKGIKPGKEIQHLLDEELVKEPDWEGLMQFFNKGKVLLILAGAKHEVARTLLNSALPQRIVFDSSLASALV